MTSDLQTNINYQRVQKHVFIQFIFLVEFFFNLELG